MADLAAHWERLGQLTSAGALRESGLPENLISDFQSNLQELENLREVTGKHLEDFCNRCSGYVDFVRPRPAGYVDTIEERIHGSLGDRSIALTSRYVNTRVTNYWKCLLLAVIGRESRSSNLSDISLIRNGSEWSLDENEAVALCVNLSSNVKIQSLIVRNHTVFGTMLVCQFVGKALKSNSVLEKLSLRGVDMSSAAVEILMTELENNTALQDLDIGANDKIGDKGIASVGQMLRKNARLRALDLQATGCGYESAKIMSVALACNTSLEKFSFGKNPLSAEGMKLLLTLFIPKGTPAAATWNSMLTLLIDKESSSPAGHSRNAKNTTIKHLAFNFMMACDISVESLALMLKTNQTLISLDLQGSSLQGHDWIEKFVPALKLNDTLKHLHLDKSRDLPSEAFMDLITSTSSKTALEEISLDETNLSSRAGVIHEELMMNKRYRKGWRDQIRLKPKSARIVLCGFAFAGKSTICNAMRDSFHGTSSIENWKGVLKRSIKKVPCIREIIFGGQAVRELDDRTRGCEIVHLRDDKQGRLSVWDFAGLKEYYALHDYLFPSFKNSCFLYVCSVQFPPYGDAQAVPNSSLYGPGCIKSREDIRNEFLYWMRFIASNSKSIAAADGQCGPIPRVILVLTNKDQLDARSLQSTTRHAREVVLEMKERFKNVIDLHGEVEVVNAHSSEDVQRLLSLAEDSLDQLLELSSEYAVCEEVRLALEDWSVRKSRPVLTMTDFKKLCEKVLSQTMDPIEYRAAKLNSTEGQVTVLAYLDYIGEIIFTESLDLIVVNSRWFGMGVLGSLIDAFRGVHMQHRRWRGVVGALENCLNPSDNSMRYQHSHGFVREQDFKEITKHLERHINPDTLIKLMIQLELCFKVDVGAEEAGIDHDIVEQSSQSISERTPLLKLEKIQPGRDHEPGNSVLFMPAVFGDGEDAVKAGGRKLQWNPLFHQEDKHYQYIGRRLECENKILTFLTPGFFPRLQVHLQKYLQEKRWTEKGFLVDRDLIGFFANGVEVLVEYSGNSVDQFVDVLVKSSQSFSEILHLIEVHVLDKIRDFCATPRGCQGVLLVEAVIRPICVRYLHSSDDRRNQAELVSLLEDRMKENGKTYQYAWREDIDDFSDLEFAMDLLEGEGSLDSLLRKQMVEAFYHASSSVTRTAVGYSAEDRNEERALVFPRLFYPTLKNASIVLKILANIDTEIPIDVHFMCESREGAHVVPDQAGRTMQLRANSNSPILKYALSLIWFGVRKSSRSEDLVEDDSWLERLFEATDVSNCIEDLFRIMDPSQPLRCASEDDIFDGFARYLQIETSTVWLLDFLFIEHRRDFWQDFQLWKVRYTDTNQIAWVCDQHYQGGTKWGKSTFRSVAH